MINNTDKKISYPSRESVRQGIENLLAKKPTQLELPFSKPKPTAEIIEFKPKPGSPILEWWKANKDKTMNLASVEDLGPFLSKFYSEKQLLEMDDDEIEILLQDLLEKGVL